MNGAIPYMPSRRVQGQFYLLALTDEGMKENNQNMSGGFKDEIDAM
jgi:hypothetical protein